MTKSLVPSRRGLALSQGSQAISYLNEIQVNALNESFQDWYDEARESLSAGQWKIRGRHWLTFLVLRYTGARLGEVIGTEDKTHAGLNDLEDIDFRQGEIRLATLKRGKHRRPVRIAPVPLQVTSEISAFWGHHPEMRGKVFSMTPMAFRKVFYERAKTAKIPAGLAHPHILRHTRAIELLRGGVPVTVVQDLLGHASLTTTAIYLRLSGQEAKGILKDRGFI